VATPIDNIKQLTIIVNRIGNTRLPVADIDIAAFFTESQKFRRASYQIHCVSIVFFALFALSESERFLCFQNLLV